MEISDLGLIDLNFDCIRALLFTKEDIDGSIEIWDAGTSLSATNLSGPGACPQKIIWCSWDSHGRPQVYNVSIPVFCILTGLQ